MSYRGGSSSGGGGGYGGGRGGGGRGGGGGGRGGGYGGGYQQGGGGRGGGGYGGGGGRGGGGRGEGRGGGGGGRGGGRGGFQRESPVPPLTVQQWREADPTSLDKEMQKKLAVSAPPSSSKSTKPPHRPGFGRVGLPCKVRANHFLVQLTERDLHHYDVTITPEVTNKNVCRDIVDRLVKAYRQSHLGKRIPAYDGKKSLYTAGPLPFQSKEFIIELPARPGRSESDARKFTVAIKFAAKVEIHNLLEYVRGRSSESPHDAIQVLDVVLRSAKDLNDYVIIGRSFYSDKLGAGHLAEGLEFWRGYYSSIRPTQMGLSLNIDASARPFYKPVEVVEFIAEYLNLRDLSRPLSDAQRVKVKKALKGVTIETNHRGFKRTDKVTGISNESSNQLMFSLSKEEDKQTSVFQYFKQKYKKQLQYPLLPCIQIGQAKKPTYLPMELCTIVRGQKYLKKLNERQVSDLLKATCQRPHQREENITKMIKDNRYSDNPMVRQEFGMQITDVCATVDARILPPPKLKYGDGPEVAPAFGQWNMINKKMFDGAEVNGWTCVSFSRTMDVRLVQQFCDSLARMCAEKGMNINRLPVVPIRAGNPNDIEGALRRVQSDVVQAAKHLKLLIIILPDVSGSYGKIKQICETELGIVSQCCRPSKACEIKPQYLENVALKINVKAGGTNAVLLDAFNKNIPRLTDRPTIIFGADVTHAAPGEDSTASIASVVASMDWPGVTKYKGLVSAQGPREEIIQDLYKIVDHPKLGRVHGGMIRELLISFKVATGKKPDRIIFFRDGVSEGQFAQVLLHEMDAIRKACASLEDGYMPRVTFVVVQKRHHTRLFPVDRDLVDKSGNIMPGTVVDTKICHPSEFDFYLCSHAGIQGTSRPTHYHVLYDENDFTADLLQLLTNSLCYTYARCTRSVSVVPPAYYAHLAAFRARYYVEGTAVSESGSTGGKDLTKDKQLEVRTLPQIKDNVKEVMFYC